MAQTKDFRISNEALAFLKGTQFAADYLELELADKACEDERRVTRKMAALMKLAGWSVLGIEYGFDYQTAEGVPGRCEHWVRAEPDKDGGMGEAPKGRDRFFDA